ncbi:acyl-CoA thioesterase [Emticicia soli]|uniref:Acyl-CoA thioesterase n=1 Tax=Emticicia soli TaxID=2027878 RepID=A0ABW5J8Z0_9BACT
MPKSKSVSYSRTTITELMIPSYANFGGKIHGGILLSLMDKVAYACASKHAGTYVVTVSVDGVNFLQPIEVGELLSLHASVNHVGRSSMVIGIRVVSENVKTGEQKHTNTSYFTMVAKDETTGKPTEVPELELESKDDIRRCLEAVRRKQLKENYKDDFDNKISELQLEENLHLLEKERIVINL